MTLPSMLIAVFWPSKSIFLGLRIIAWNLSGFVVDSYRDTYMQQVDRPSLGLPLQLRCTTGGRSQALKV